MVYRNVENIHLLKASRYLLPNRSNIYCLKKLRPHHRDVVSLNHPITKLKTIAYSNNFGCSKVFQDSYSRVRESAAKMLLKNKKEKRRKNEKYRVKVAKDPVNIGEI